MDETTDPNLKSFIPVSEDSHFPIQNLPYGVFQRSDDEKPRIGVAIGEYILDLSILEKEGFFNDTSLSETHVFSRSTLNDFMALGKKAWDEARHVISSVLRNDNPALRDNKELQRKCLVPQSAAKMCMPVSTIDFTDFYSSKYHASNVGAMIRGPENALYPNWLHLPVAYHGRASSIILSGENFHRPWGQILPDNEKTPIFSPTQALDFELEMGFYIGVGNELGNPIPIDKATDHIFGMVLVNDWSARDIQKWEYVPLGPFLAKSFATSISPWVVPLTALEPFKCEGVKQEPEPLPYLRLEKNWTFDIKLEVYLKTQKLTTPYKIVSSNFKYLYWNIAQQVAHHTVNGCNLQTGDLLASGTISGPTVESLGCLLEITQLGRRPLVLPNGEKRVFLHDYDSVIMTAWCQGNGYKVGFGNVTTTVLPAQLKSHPK